MHLKIAENTFVAKVCLSVTRLTHVKGLAKNYYFISKLVRAVWLVNLVGRTLLRGPLKFKVSFAAELLRDSSPNFLNLWSK